LEKVVCTWEGVLVGVVSTTIVNNKLAMIVTMIVDVTTMIVTVTMVAKDEEREKEGEAETEGEAEGDTDGKISYYLRGLSTFDFSRQEEGASQHSYSEGGRTDEDNLQRGG
jgi:hypothetical protein